VAMMPHERSLVKRMEGKPFVLLGVDSVDSREKLKATLKEKDLTWRNFADEDGHITAAWEVEAFPTIVLIDHKGVVRHHNLGAPREKDLDKAIDRLVEEAEKDAGRPSS
jgi:peroxiredoxin